jgi:hypothetical protein
MINNRSLKRILKVYFITKALSIMLPTHAIMRNRSPLILKF